MKKRLVPSLGIFIAIALLFIVAITGCNGKTDLKATVTSGGQIIPVLEDGEESFAPLIPQEGFTEIPYIQIGSDVEVTFEDQVPEPVEIEDIVLDKDGNPKYRRNAVPSVDYVLQDNTMVFQLGTHSDVFLSSDADDYLPGNVVRGIRLVCQLDDQEVTLLMVIRTDAEL